MVDSWPVGFPQRFNRAGNSGGLGDGLIETQPDIGPPISRRRTTAVVDMLAGSMNFSDSELASLKFFYRTTLLMGSLPFDFPDQTTANTATLVKFQRGKPLTWSEVGPDNYLVQMSLLVLP